MNKSKKWLFVLLGLVAVVGIGIGVSQFSTQNNANMKTEERSEQESDSKQKTSLKSSSKENKKEEEKTATQKVKTSATTWDKKTKAEKENLNKFNANAVESGFYIQGNTGFEKASIENLKAVETKQTLEAVSYVKDPADGKMKYLITFKE